MRLAAAALLLAAPAAAQELEALPMHYGCDRGARIEAVYVNGGMPALAILTLEGRMVVLSNVPSGSGAFYAEAPEGRAGYFWRTKGEEATLSWRAADGAETDLLDGCTALPQG